MEALIPQARLLVTRLGIGATPQAARCGLTKIGRRRGCAWLSAIARKLRQDAATDLLARGPIVPMHAARALRRQMQFIELPRVP